MRSLNNFEWMSRHPRHGPLLWLLLYFLCFSSTQILILTTFIPRYGVFQMACPLEYLYNGTTIIQSTGSLLFTPYSSGPTFNECESNRFSLHHFLTHVLSFHCHSCDTSLGFNSLSLLSLSLPL